MGVEVGRGIGFGEVVGDWEWFGFSHFAIHGEACAHEKELEGIQGEFSVFMFSSWAVCEYGFFF